MVDTAVQRPPARPQASAARSGVVIAAASLAGIVLSYGFLLVAGRTLGADGYGALAALLGLLTVVLLPAGGLQLAVSREVSRLEASGESATSDAFLRATVRLGAIVTIPLLAAGLVLAYPIARLLDIPTGPVVLTMVGLATTLLAPIAIGSIQGLQRFTALAVMYVLPFALRLGILLLLLAVGFRLGGAVFATVAAALATTALALVLVRDQLVRGARHVRPTLAPFLRYLGPVLLGLIGLAVLTNVDILVVKTRFSSGDAGDYAAAAAFAKVAFFLPATILSVLFPRTAARQARGEETEDILGRSLIVTAGFCSLLALFYVLAGRGLVVTTYGAEFVEGGKLTAPFAVAMGLYSVANILVGYHLSRGETRYAWIVALAIPVQLVALSIVPASLEDVVWTNLVVATALLMAHEIFVDSSVPALGAGFRQLVAGIEIPRRYVVESLVVLLGATVFVCALFWPVVTGFNSTIVGNGSDAVAAVWSFWRLQHEGGYHLFGITHHELTGAPFGWDEGNGLNLQALLAYYPAYLLTKVVGSTAAYNVVLFSGYVLSGASMYLLARYLGCARLVAAWAGMVYVIFPWHLVRTPHGSLVHLELLPLLLLALVAASQRPTWPRFGLVGVVTLGCWLTAGYIGTMALVGAAAFALAVLAIVPWRRWLAFASGTVGCALAASFFVALLSVLSGVGRGVGLKRSAGDLSIYGLRPYELVVPDPRNLVVGHRTGSFLGDHLHGSNPTETANYVGLLTLALAVAWVVFAWRRWGSIEPRLRAATVGLIGVLVAALLLSAPSPVSVFGHLVTMPSRVLWEVVPAIRVPSRWVALGVTALVPIAALALQAGWRRFEAKGRPLAATGIVLAAVVVSFLELAVNPARPRITTTLPPEYAAVERTPRGILAEYPLAENVDYLLWQREHGRPVLNNSAIGTAPWEATRVLADPAAPGTAQQLAFLGVTTMLTHPNALDYTEGVPDVPNASWGPGYALVARAPDGASVWRVVARPAAALVTLPGGFGGPLRADEAGHVGYPLDAPSGVGTMQFTAKEPGVVRLTFDAAPPHREQTLRLADDQSEVPFDLTSRASVSALVQVPRGTSYLLVKTDPAATSDDDAIVISAPLAEPASGEPQLEAVPISADPGF